MFEDISVFHFTSECVFFSTPCMATKIFAIRKSVDIEPADLATYYSYEYYSDYKNDKPDTVVGPYHLFSLCEKDLKGFAKKVFEAL